MSTFTRVYADPIITPVEWLATDNESLGGCSECVGWFIDFVDGEPFDYMGPVIREWHEARCPIITEGIN